MKQIRRSGKLVWGDGFPTAGDPGSAVFREDAPAVIEENGTSYWCVPERKNQNRSDRKDRHTRAVLWPTRRENEEGAVGIRVHVQWAWPSEGSVSWG